jgi:hypothetical protein
MKRPIESDYTSHVAYTRALEEYCDAFAQPAPLEKFCDSNCVWTDHHPDCNLAQPERELNTLSVCEDIQQLCINGELPFHFEDVCDWIEKEKILSPPQRKPLTNQQIEAIHQSTWVQSTATLNDFARAIEAAHGIKGEA